MVNLVRFIKGKNIRTKEIVAIKFEKNKLYFQIIEERDNYS